MCMVALPASVSAHHVREYSQRSEEGVGSSRAGVRDSCESPWVPGIEPLQHQPVLFTTEPSLQPHFRSSTRSPQIYDPLASAF